MTDPDAPLEPEDFPIITGWLIFCMVVIWMLYKVTK